MHRHSVFRALILLMALGVGALWLARPSTVVADEWKQSVASIKNELATTKNELANLKERKTWPEGSYCIFQGAANTCPSEFKRVHRYMRGIKMHDSMNFNFITRSPWGASFINSHRPLNVPEVSKPYPSPDGLGDIEFFLCCK